MRFEEAWAQEAEVVVEGVGVGVGRGYFVELDGAVALAAEASAVAGVVADGFQAGALLGGAGVEGWVDIDEGDRAARERAEGGEVFGLENLVHRDEPYRTWLGREKRSRKGR